MSKLPNRDNLAFYNSYSKAQDAELTLEAKHGMDITSLTIALLRAKTNNYPLIAAIILPSSLLYSIDQ